MTRACRLTGMSRSQFNYTTRKKEDAVVVSEIYKIKEKYPSYGVPRVTAVLRKKDAE